jgi:hypothetical protein
VTNSRFANGNNKAIAIEAKEMTIRNNSIQWMRRNGIQLIADLRVQVMGGGPPIAGEISNNEIEYTNVGRQSVSRTNLVPGAIATAIVRKDLVWPTGGKVFDNNHYFQNIVMANNRIIGSGGYAFFLLNAAGFNIKDNTIRHACSLNRGEESREWGLGVPDRPIYVDASQNIVFAGNTISDPGDYCTGDMPIQLGDLADSDTIIADFEGIKSKHD